MFDAVAITCPYCGERFQSLADASAGDADYIEDCPVCCRPISMHLQLDADGTVAALTVDRDD